MNQPLLTLQGIDKHVTFTLMGVMAAVVLVAAAREASTGGVDKA